MANQQASNPPSAAYYLTLIGGILGIIVGAFLLLIVIGVWLIIANVLLVVFAQSLMAHPEEHSKYGTLIIVFSILSGINILALIGGVLALTYQRAPAAPAQPYQTYAPPTYAPPSTQPITYATTKYCTQCGNPVGGEAQYCPKCGKKLSP